MINGKFSFSIQTISSIFLITHTRLIKNIPGLPTNDGAAAKKKKISVFRFYIQYIEYTNFIF